MIGGELMLSGLAGLWFGCAQHPREVLTVQELPKPALPTPLGELRRLLDDGRYAEAENVAREEFARCAQNETLESPVLEAWLGEALRRGGKQDQPETLAHARRAVERASALFGDADARTGECLFQLGALHYTRDELGEARTALEGALAVREATLGPRSPEVAMTLVFLASLAWDGERDDERAFALFERARAIQTIELGEEHPDIAWRLEREAIVELALERFDRARPLLERALAIREKSLRPDHPMIGVTLYNLGALATRERDWIAARAYSERALEVRRSTHGPEHPNVVWTLIELGKLAL